MLGERRASFGEHQMWLHSLRRSYDSLRAEAASGREEGELKDSGSGRKELACFLPPPEMPQPEETPLASGHSESDDVALSSDFDRALDFDDFNEPVYRSLGLVLAAEDAAVISEEEIPIEPVYRGRLRAREDEDEEGVADTVWLASMPPLVKRQRAAICV